MEDARPLSCRAGTGGVAPWSPCSPDLRRSHPAWKSCPHTSTSCSVGHLLQLFPDHDLLGQSSHFLGQDGKAHGAGLRRVSPLLLQLASRLWDPAVELA